MIALPFPQREEKGPSESIPERGRKRRERKVQRKDLIIGGKYWENIPNIMGQ